MFSIRKARAATPHDFVAKSKPKKSKAGKDALKKLNDYLNSASSEPMYFLHNFWKAQSNAITYKELREAIMNGYLDEATLQAWQQDYSLFVKSHLEPIWQQAAKAGADALAASASGGWVFDPMSDAMTAWIKDHGAEWVTKIAVKIDSFAYMPVQELGNAFSTFVAQNFGASKRGRIRRGVKQALLMTTVFSLVVSAAVFVLAKPLMMIFVDGSQHDIISIGVRYLRIEGAFYVGIGVLFLLYGYYRAIRMPGMSVVLTVLSLGLRVALAYALSAVPGIGVDGIWWSIPIGWAVADAVGMLYYGKTLRRIYARRGNAAHAMTVRT